MAVIPPPPDGPATGVNYDDLVAGKAIKHSRYGTGWIEDRPPRWERGQVRVVFALRGAVFCNPDRLSTEDS